VDLAKALTLQVTKRPVQSFSGRSNTIATGMQ
jgi:hypothetical protein